MRFRRRRRRMTVGELQAQLEADTREFDKSLRSVQQARYEPGGSIFGDAWKDYREGGHSDHKPVATYDRGGILKPGLALVYNGTYPPPFRKRIRLAWRILRGRKR